MSTQLEFVGHACFRIWEEGRPTLLLDPFTPETVRLAGDLKLEAQTVIVSSLTDPAHDNFKMAIGTPRVINALDVARGEATATINGEPLIAVAAHEAADHTEHSPMDNALYAFKSGGLWIMHMGDLGYQLDERELKPFVGHCDLFLVITGEANTPAHADLSHMIDILQPRWLVPMHYYLPPVTFNMSPVQKFLAHRAGDPVILLRQHTLSLPPPELNPGRPTILVFEPSGYTPSQPVVDWAGQRGAQ
jgi:L-ascorbate metabolism protein UlaG (beta-lactamase superfamily)